MGQTWASLMNEGGYSQLNTGTALNTSTSLTDISPGGNVAGQAYQFNADYLQVGFQFLVYASGIVSNTSTPTLNLGLYFGGIAGTALATTGALTTTSGLSNTTWELEAKMRVDAVGTSGSIRTNGHVLGPIFGTTTCVMIPASSSSGNNVTVNTGAASNILTVGAQWSASSASNSIQVIEFAVVKFNEGNV